jgi:hypothetical protein
VGEKYLLSSKKIAFFLATTNICFTRSLHVLHFLSPNPYIPTHPKQNKTKQNKTKQNKTKQKQPNNNNPAGTRACSSGSRRRSKR